MEGLLSDLCPIYRQFIRSLGLGELERVTSFLNNYPHKHYNFCRFLNKAGEQKSLTNFLQSDLVNSFPLLQQSSIQSREFAGTGGGAPEQHSVQQIQQVLYVPDPLTKGLQLACAKTLPKTNHQSVHILVDVL